MKKIIFDIDQTLLKCDWDKEDNMFIEMLGEEKGKIFLDNKINLLLGYEKTHYKYDIGEFNNYIKYKNIPCSEKVIKAWIYEVAHNLPDTIVDGSFELLEYLKIRNYEIVALTNWFTYSQKNRLKRSGMLSYFSEVYGGDYALKPNSDAYKNIVKDTNKMNCYMIGDNLELDYNAPRKFGIHAILFDEKEENKDNYVIKVKRLEKIKEMI